MSSGLRLVRQWKPKAPARPALAVFWKASPVMKTSSAVRLRLGLMLRAFALGLRLSCVCCKMLNGYRPASALKQ